MSAAAGIHPGDLAHWCVVPILAGLAMAVVAFRRAFRHRLGPFDPLLWLEGSAIYIVGVAPLAHVLFRRYTEATVVPGDFRPWMGAMAAFNLAGLGLRWWLTTPVYRERAAAGAENGGPGHVDPPHAARIADLSRWWFVLAAGSLVALLAAVGGPAGFLREAALRHDGFRGLGVLTLFADLLPMAGLLWWLAAGLGRPVSAGRLWTALATAGALQFAVSGLRGSRVQLVFFGLVAVGWLCWRGLRLRARSLAALVLLALAFSYSYTLYKDTGPATFLRVVTGREKKPENTNKRDLGTLLLGDLGRADVQAAILWSVTTHPTGAPLAMGRTYVSDVLVHVPGFARPDLPAWTKMTVGGTRLFRALPPGFRPGYIYGLAGEALLNFGPLAVLPMMALHAWLVLVTMRWCDRKRREGLPVALLWPSITILLITAWLSDLDQVVYLALRFGLLPAVVVLAAWRMPSPPGSRRAAPPGNDRMAFWLFCLTGASLPFWNFPPLTIAGKGVDLATLFAALFVALSARQLPCKPDRKVVLWLATAAAVPLLVLPASPASASTFQARQFALTYAHWLLVTAFFAFALHLRLSRRDWRDLVLVQLASGLAVSLFCFYQLLGRPLGWPATGRVISSLQRMEFTSGTFGGYERPTSFLLEPAFLGTYLVWVAVLPLAALLGEEEARPRLRAFLAAVLGTLVLALVASASLGAYLDLAILAVLLIWRARGRVNARGRVAASLVLAGAVVLAFGIDTALAHGPSRAALARISETGTLLREGRYSEIGTHRAGLHLREARLAKENLATGVGLGQYKLLSGSMVGPYVGTNEVVSGWLGATAEMGLPGLAVLVAALLLARSKGGGVTVALLTGFAVVNQLHAAGYVELAFWYPLSVCAVASRLAGSGPGVPGTPDSP